MSTDRPAGCQRSCGEYDLFADEYVRQMHDNRRTSWKCPYCQSHAVYASISFDNTPEGNHIMWNGERIELPEVML